MEGGEIMEIPEIYARMCDCEEIQDQYQRCKGLFGDYFADLTQPENTICIRNVRILATDIWIPRQDQLQVMLRRCYDKDEFNGSTPDDWFPRGNVGLTFVLRKFQEFTARKDGELTLFAYNATSFEELWLNLYMWEAHRMTWRRDKWIESKTEIPITPVKGSDGHKERLKEINKILNDPDAKKKQKENWAEMEKMGKR